jgi:hypothetical protein
MLGAFGGPMPAVAADSDDIATLVNQERWAQGLPGLLRNADLDAVAAAWAQQLGASGTLAHNPNTPNQIPAGWRSWGENVGQGYGSGAAMHQGWMDSERHRENVLGDFTDLGVAFIAAGGTWWGVEVFAHYPGHVGPAAPPAAPPEQAPAPPAAPPQASAEPAPPAPPPAPTPPAPTPAPSATPSPSATPPPAPAAEAPMAPGTDSDGTPVAAVATLGGVGLLVLAAAGILLLPATRRGLTTLFRSRVRRR